MSILTLSTVKTRFPEWEKYLVITINDTDEQKDAKLQLVVDNADAELSEYVDVNADTITPALTNHLMNIIRKHAFDLKNGNRATEVKPQVIRDYEHSLAQLKSYQAGFRNVPLADGETDTQLDVSVKNARTRKFSVWFTDPE
jgi:hypothetical protein